jgi:hypothetical protein
LTRAAHPIDSETPLSEGTQYTFTTPSDDSLDTQTVSQNPALANVQVCTVTGCSAAVSKDLLYLYPPGQPKVDSLSPKSGSAAGGTKILVKGENLGCPLSADFGTTEAASITEIPGLLDCGATTEVDVVSPAGAEGTEVPVTIATVESYFTETSDAPSRAGFTYTSP